MAQCTADLYGSQPMVAWDATNDRKTRIAENRFLERCHLPTWPVDATAGSATDEDEDEDEDDYDYEDDDDDTEEAARTPQMVAFLALETQLHEVVHDCRLLTDEAKRPTALVIGMLSKAKMTLLLSPDTFGAAEEADVIDSVGIDVT